MASVAAIALITPVVDVDDIHDNNRNGYAAEIEARYGGLAAFDAALPTHNPVAFAGQLAGIPIKVWISSNDPVVIPATVDAFAAGSGAAVASLGAVGHTAGALDGADVASFLLPHA